MGREKLFHCFIHCKRLQSLFEVLTMIFDGFNETFSVTVFIYGFKESKVKKRVGRLLNFIIGQAKMSIYLSRKQNIDFGNDCNIVKVFK